jgi:hypothetical protein
MKIVKNLPWIELYLNDSLKSEISWDYHTRNNAWYHYCGKMTPMRDIVSDQEKIICPACKEEIPPHIIFQVKLRILE